MVMAEVQDELKKIIHDCAVDAGFRRHFSNTDLGNWPDNAEDILNNLNDFQLAIVREDMMPYMPDELSNVDLFQEVIQSDIACFEREFTNFYRVLAKCWLV